ncbi:right-handed parallel beta-helix repeat-containing protein, partial [Candidatus Woesearchaeota archaeon]|nr:right-handed parallel beta-helix repeat-containing protein [Candidatus Woesearchaeota archaeon]
MTELDDRINELRREIGDVNAEIKRETTIAKAPEPDKQEAVKLPEAPSYRPTPAAVTQQKKEETPKPATIADNTQEEAKIPAPADTHRREKYGAAILVVLVLMLTALLAFRFLSPTGLATIGNDTTEALTEQQVMQDLGVEEVVTAEDVGGVNLITTSTTVEEENETPEEIQGTANDTASEPVNETPVQEGPAILVELDSPAEGANTSTEPTLSFTVNTSADCTAYLLYRWIQTEFQQAGSIDAQAGNNSINISLLQEGEYLWKIGCIAGDEEVFSDTWNFLSYAIIKNETNLTQNLTNVSMNLTNATIDLTNETLNITNITNQTIPATNITIANETANITANMTNATAITTTLNETAYPEELEQGQAAVDVPVNWTRRIMVNQTGNLTFTVTLPKGAELLDVIEATGGIETAANETETPADDPSSKLWKKWHKREEVVRKKLDKDKYTINITLISNLLQEESNTSPEPGQTPAITGFSVSETQTGKGLVSRFFNWLSGFFGVTGAAVVDTDSVQLDTPAEGETVGRNINLLYTTSRDFDGCYLNIDGVVAQQDLVVVGGTNFFELRYLNEGEHTWFVTCYDRRTGLQSETRTFIVGEIEEPSLDSPAGSETELNITTEVTSAPTVFEISYSTPGPAKNETEEGALLKRIVISSELGYQEIKAQTSVRPVPEWLVKLNWKHNDSAYEAVSNFTRLDDDADGLVDAIEWTVPHLSEQTYEVNLSYEITQLELVSAERIGDNSTEDVATLVAENDSSFIELNKEHLNVTFSQPLAVNDTVSVYAWSNKDAPLYVLDSVDGNVLSTITITKGEWRWYNLTLTGLNRSLAAVYLYAENNVKYDSLTAYDRKVVIPMKVVPPASNLSFVLVRNATVDVTDTYQFEPAGVIVETETSAPVVEFEVYFQNAETDVNLSGLVAETDPVQNKAVMHMDVWPAEVSYNKTLYVPSSGRGLVYVCPNASSISEVYEGCAAMYYVSPGQNNITIGNETQTVTVEQVVLNGQAFYRVSGLTGTGGGESITILNAYTFLKDNETWIVWFNTTGTANLTITPVGSLLDGGWTEFLTDNASTENEMTFLNISCGGSDLADLLLVVVNDSGNISYHNYSLLTSNDTYAANSLMIADYSCGGLTGSISNLVHHSGYMGLEFTFGNQTAYAWDPPCYDTDGDRTYNTSSASDCEGYRDCNDYNASIFPPHDGMDTSGNVILCSGTYYVNDSGNDGVGVLYSGSVGNGSLEYINTSTTQNFLIVNQSSIGFSYPDTSYNSINDTFIVVWENETSATVGYRIFDSDGNPKTGIVQTTMPTSNTIKASYNNDSNQWLIVSGSGWIYGQFVYANGTMNGNYFNIITESNDYGPYVAYNYKDHQWLMVFHDYIDSGHAYISGRLINMSGPLGSKITIISGDRYRYSPHIAYNPVNNSWMLEYNDNTVLEYLEHYATVLNATGTPKFYKQLTNDDAGNSIGHVACDNDDDTCLVSFTSYRGLSYNIVTRLINSTGGVEFDTNVTAGYTEMGYGRRHPAVIHNDELNEWVVAWQTYYDEADTLADIRVQRLNSTGGFVQTGQNEGIPVSNESNTQGYPAMAFSPVKQRMMVVFEDDRDGTSSIYGQLIAYNNTRDIRSIKGSNTRMIGNNSGYGLYGAEVSHLNISGITLSNYSTGVYLGKSNSDSVIYNVTIANTTYGVYINQSDDNIVTNTTLYNNDYGMYIEDSEGNLVYDVNFSANSLYHAYADSPGNSFNTTSSDGPLGNYWDDVLSLSIYDTDNDGVGDAGGQYPYGFSGAKTGGYVLDYGPFSDKLNTAPTASNVKLNSSYNGNFTNENLEATASIYDADGDRVYNITDWRRNGSSIALVNMPFEGEYNTKDYSTNDNYGTPGYFQFHKFETGTDGWSLRDGAWWWPTQDCTTAAVGNCSIVSFDNDGGSGSFYIFTNAETNYSSSGVEFDFWYKCEAGARWGMMTYSVDVGWHCVK